MWVRHHQEGDRVRGLASLGSETCETLGRRRRWRQPPPLISQALAPALALVLHALFALAVWHEMQPRPAHLAAVPVDVDQALIVRLLDHPRAPHAAQPPPSPTPPRLVSPRRVVTPRVHRVTHDKPRRDAMVVQNHDATPSAATLATPAAIGLFARDGSARLPPAATGAPATASAETTPAQPADDRRIMQHDSNRMHYKATRFEKYFPPPNETAGGALGRHMGDAIKEIAKSMCNPAKRSTASNLLCAVPPLPPSPKDGDERLNLPPPSLAGDPHPPRPPLLSTCIAEYNGTRPLSYGCPLNTPELAFQAEMRECIDLFRAGKRLKTWCPADTPKRAAAESVRPAASSNRGSH
ncbi:MAG TPA: hypothetical protein VGN24_09220 [Rhodanobacter sp.]|jgi:hypothetical protein|nr:hypothetical protein [Rhodanobacter sp.]